MLTACSTPHWNGSVWLRKRKSDFVINLGSLKPRRLNRRVITTIALFPLWISSLKLTLSLKVQNHFPLIHPHELNQSLSRVSSSSSSSLTRSLTRVARVCSPVLICPVQMSLIYWIWFILTTFRWDLNLSLVDHPIQNKLT